MKERSNSFRRGSALLIVLAMVTFMVISAVGFAVYMRQSRMPSSHLRRESLSRYLLKSALANAVARLDGVFDRDRRRIEGVYDDVYPGILPNGYNRGAYESENGDFWLKRVFTPFGVTDPIKTVSTLTLEGLAYLPPAIVNEVRVHSRTTRTAQWRNLSYDLGRYAFCAVDVSDCFDVNKLASVKRRTSHAGERISLASLYPDNPDDLASKILNAPKFSQTPFVSLADFNLGLGSTEYTPFVRYINNGGNNGKIYLNDDKAVSNALFVTDTWFPATNAYLTADLELKNAAADATHYFDLSAEGSQPWKRGEFGVDSFPYIPCSAGLGKVMQKNLGGVGLACLYDYLDADQVPISLALPTVEAVPMICGVNLAGAPSLEFEEQPGGVGADVKPSGKWYYTDKDGNVREITREVKTMQFKGAELDKCFVSGTVMFPFKRMKSDKRETDGFQVEALAAVFFGPADMKCRLSNESFRPTKEDWQNGGFRDGIVFYKGMSDSLSFGSDIKKTEDAFKTFKCQLKAPAGISLPAFYTVSEKETTQKQLGVDYTPLPEGLLEQNVVTADGTKQLTGFTLFDKLGNASAEQKALCGAKLFSASDRQGANGAAGTKQQAASLQGTYVPYVAIWVRVVKDGDAVDLVPAVCEDDEIHINGCRYGNAALFDKLCHPFCGDGVPLLDFKDTRPEMAFQFSASLQNTISAQPFEPQPWKSLYAVDPRYNFAPEDWISSTEVDANPNRWRTLMKANAGDTGYFGGERDRDIFMFTSDQENLQSIGELQFLPFVQKLGRTGVSMSECDFKGAARYHGQNFDALPRTDPTSENLANRNYFWRTYSACRDTVGMNPYDTVGMNPYYDMIAEDNKPVTVVNGSGDFRVNPLSSDTRVIAAAVADTPWDYYVASTNRENKVISAVEGTPETFAFGTAASIAEDAWDDLAINDIAGAIRSRIRNGAENTTGVFDWGIPYEDLWFDDADIGNGLHDDQERLFDVDLGGNCLLHGVDRKFLFSYWRECFQNRQQLFLIFLRAEPLTVGGAGGDSLAPAQLGARGVALVWRDPAPPKSVNGGTRARRNAISTEQAWREQMENCPPHRTRVLFYHQFD